MDRECSKKLPVNGFKWIKKLSKFDEDFIKNYDENNNKGYIFEVDVEYPKNLYGDLPFLAEKKEIKQNNKLVCNIHYKENYIVHIRALKQTTDHRLVLKRYIE